MEPKTKIHSTSNFLFISIAIGALILSNSTVEAEVKLPDLYVIDITGTPIKIDLTNHSIEANLTIEELSTSVFFSLYTRATNDTPEELHIDDVDNLRNSHFDPNKPTKFVTHGWMSSCETDTCTKIRGAFLQHGDYNVIEIDWGEVANKPYIWASSQTLTVAQYVSRMLDFLYSQGLNPSNVAMVGHSLGAHVVALSSFYAKSKVDFIVGLDPAAPGFYLAGPNAEITKTDANYVLIIHTTALLGIFDEIGDSDFYPNGGSLQPNCGIDLGESCSHERSHEYYAESINDDRFVSRKCDSYIDYEIGLCNSNSVARMGGVTPDYNVKGKYYLHTNSKPPYAKG